MLIGKEIDLHLVINTLSFSHCELNANLLKDNYICGNHILGSEKCTCIYNELFTKIARSSMDC